MSGIQPQNPTPLQKSEAYELIRSQLAGIVGDGKIVWESALTSLIALIKEHHPRVSWVGFYRNHDGHLWVGPYQGKLACLHLGPGQGVCGHALTTKSPQVVEDVHAFSGHVACDPLSRSEIVLPVFQGRQLVGVLDLDSYEPSAFDAMDQKELEHCLKAIEPLPTRVS